MSLLTRRTFLYNSEKPFDIEIKTPYIYRQTAGGIPVGKKKQMTIVGGTIAWNQLVDANTESVTTENNVKYLTRIGGVDSIITGDGTDIAVTGGSDNVFDLTHMFGATVSAQMTVDKFRELFPNSYYGYNTGELISVKTSEHITTTSYLLDSSLELRGIPRLDTDNNLYYDGDIYEANGTVTRNYYQVDLGSINWSYASGNKYFRGNVGGDDRPLHIVCDKFRFGGRQSNGTGMENVPEKVIYQRYSASYGYYTTIMIKDLQYSTSAAFKEAVAGIKVILNRSYPITATAQPFAETMEVNSSGTQQFIDSRTVPMPVGNISMYQQI